MQALQTLILSLSNQDFLAKIILVIILALYSLFALVLTNQVRVLSRTVNQIHFAPIFQALAYIHTTIAVLLLISVVLFL
jgi:hypothetical protein